MLHFAKCDLKVNSDLSNARRARFARPWVRVARSRTYLCHQPWSVEIDVGKRQRREGTRGVLGKPPIAHLGEAPQPLDDAQDVFDASADARLVAVLLPRRLVCLALPVAHTLVGEVLGMRRLAADQLFLARIGAVAVDAPLVAMWTAICGRITQPLPANFLKLARPTDSLR